MGFIQLNVVQDVIGAVTDGGPFGDLLFRVDDLIRTVAEEELRVHITCCTGNDQLRTQLLQGAGSLQRALEVLADRNKADVEVIHPQGFQKIPVGAVADLGVGDIGQQLVDALFVVIHHHDLMVQSVQIHGDVLAEATDTDEQNAFHLSFLLYPTVILSCGSLEGRFWVVESAA